MVYKNILRGLFFLFVLILFFLSLKSTALAYDGICYYNVTQYKCTKFNACEISFQGQYESPCNYSSAYPGECLGTFTNSDTCTSSFGASCSVHSGGISFVNCPGTVGNTGGVGSGSIICDTCSGGYGACNPSCGPGSKTCTLDTYVGANDDPCTVLHGGSYYYGGACNNAKTKLYQCGGSPNHGSGYSTSSQVCHCQVNNGTYDSCPNGPIACTQSTSAPQACNNGACCSAVNGHWNGGFGACSSTCQAQQGNQTRPDYTWANECGNNDAWDNDPWGDQTSIACYGNVPTVDGGWSASWDQCTKTCGGGKQYKYCNNPVPNSCGGGCSAGSSISQDCNMQSCTYNVNTYVYVDYNGNGFKDAGEPYYAPENSYSPSNDITYSGAKSGTGSSGAGGYYQIVSVPSGTNNETVTVTPPSGWHPTTTNPQTTGAGSTDLTVNFGIQPPAPTCTITANPTTVYTQAPGNTSTLTTTVTKAPSYTGNITYSWGTGGQVTGSINPTTAGPTTNTSATTTWTAPNTLWDQGKTAQPTSTVCQTGTSLCSSCQAGVNPSGPPIIVIPEYSISGLIFVDANKDGIQNNGDQLYNGSPLLVSICPGHFCKTGGTPITATGGNFTTGATPVLPAGTYTVSITALPGDASYSFTAGSSGFAIALGKPCPASEPSGSCDGPTGNVSGVAFGISNSNPWIQTTGGDVYMGGGIAYKIPNAAPSTCGGANMSVADTYRVNPGVIYTGNGNASVGHGQFSPNPWNWAVGQNPFGEQFNLASPNSYKDVSDTLNANNITPKDLSTVSGCSYNPANNLTTCNLSTANLPSDKYKSNNNLKLTADGSPASYTFPTGKNYTFLINGNLDIETKISIPTNSTALFSASGNITVGANVGETASTTTCVPSATGQSTGCDIDGYYSADGNFTVEGANNCPTTDVRLNMSGAVVTNADGMGTGSFNVNRDMCEQDVCPTFSIVARPDFVLNAPATYLSPSRIWKAALP